MKGDFIQKMYFPFKKSNKKKKYFSLSDQLSCIWFLKPICCLFKPKKKDQFLKLKEMIEK